MIEERNARIKSTFLGIEDHGITTAMLHLEYAGGGQGFGGYGLGNHEKPVPHCGLFIRRVLEVVGVDSWEKLLGKHVRVRAEHIKVHAIGHIVEDRWFNPAEEFDAFKVMSEERKGS